MTTFIDFAPSAIAPFHFQVTLDGQQYNAVVTWSLFGRRFYLNLFALDGTRIVTKAIVSSPGGVAIEAMSWSGAKVAVTTSVPHGYKLGTVISLTIAGCSPDSYNGTVPCTITGPDTFTYPLATNPGAATTFGSATYNISLTAGYFTSTLVFRDQSQQFEVGP